MEIKKHSYKKMSLRKSHQVASLPLPFQVDEEGVHPEMKQLVLIDIHVLRPENIKFIKKTQILLLGSDCGNGNFEEQSKLYGFSIFNNKYY